MYVHPCEVGGRRCSRFHHRWRYLWPFVGDGKLAVFEFLESRSREGPSGFLSGFTDRCFLSDGYAGYREVIEKNNLTHLMCWAHVRRKFFEKKDFDPQFVDEVLGLIKELYKVVDDAADKTPEERKLVRQERSVCVLEAIKTLLEERAKSMLPKNPLCEAINYTLNHWRQLTAYLQDGRLPIDNNLVENTIRPVALGRKNWLFARISGRDEAHGHNLLAACYMQTPRHQPLRIFRRHPAESSRVSGK